MAYEPRFCYTNEVVGRLMTIESARAVVDILPVPPDAAFMMKYEAQQRATHYSTSIEGNELALEEVREGIALANRTGSKQQEEVRNYWRALEWIERQMDDAAAIDEDFIRRLHAIIEVRGHGRRGEMSDYRTVERPVVDSATRAVEYGPPTPDDVPHLMAELVEWLLSDTAARLPAPIRAGILAYRFVTIHPFLDGNGRTTRALATAELWCSGYWMRGFVSVEEHYYRDLQRYYDRLQRGLPVHYYEGRHDPDMTPWLEYFVETLAGAACDVRDRALALQERSEQPPAPWESLSRRQQQLLARLVIASPESEETPTLTAGDLEEWFGISRRTGRRWLHSWHDEGFVEPASGQTRVSAWRLGQDHAPLVAGVRRAITERE